MHLAIHEIDAAREAITGDATQPAFKILSRVARIFEQLNNARDVVLCHLRGDKDPAGRSGTQARERLVSTHPFGGLGEKHPRHH